MAKLSSVILGALLLLLVAQCATAARWTSPVRGGCLRRGTRRWTATLVDFGPDGLGLCRRTYANIGGQRFNGANECRQAGRGIIGTFYVNDRTCTRFTDQEAEAVVPVTEEMVTVIEEVVAVTEEVAPVFAPHWGRFHRDGCLRKKRGYRRWTARLLDVGSGNWNATCLRTPATIRRQKFAHPAHCRKNRKGHVIGVFYVRDRTCRRVSDLQEALELEMETVHFEEAALNLQEALAFEVESALEVEDAVNVDENEDVNVEFEAVDVEAEALG
ncbi:hypothetical protein KC19_1G147800 [Ceratodon purpureus]|uniref:C-type lectin domain-containing protein n=1 Tax=Ceratodon purpureus TaxID=3225 RepID=A0A8T0J7X6_CERPU|nr:hypothetical protein KC19_1G147800 [Ceratodon purpureus]